MATANITVGRVRAIIADEHPDGFSWSRSAWSRGVREYALDLLADWPYGTPLDAATVVDKLKNGADSWGQYSRDGSALVYDDDIAERLCTPSELKRKHGGKLAPNKRETWLDVQSRALFQAAELIRLIVTRMA